MRMLIRTGERTRIEGVTILDVARDGNAQASFQTIREALALMRACDLPSLERVQRELDQIVVFNGVGAQYLPELNACFLDTGYMVRQPVARIAMSLVHEATHAELFRQGHGYEPDARAGIETTCVEAEIAFAERVPGTEDLIAHSRRQLANPWWTDVALFDRRIALYRTGGWPEWLVGWYERKYRPPEERGSPQE